MANRTDPTAKNIRGTNPQNLVEKILRSKIYQHTYWKEQCFGLTAETLVDKAMELDHLGGTYGGNRKPTPFMCLVMKMLQIQPEKDIVVEFIKNEDYKYVRVLGAFYLRLTGTDIDVYRYLEPLYNDYRKLRKKLTDGKFALTHMDEVIDELLTKDYSCDIAMPRIKKRWTLETLAALEPRKSVLEDDFEEEEEREENEQLEGLDNGADERDYYHERSPARERERDRDRDRDRRRDSHRHRDRDYDRDYDKDYDRERGRGRERDRDRDRDRYRLRDERDYGHDWEREREREGRERERRDRDRGRRRSHSRSRSRSRDRKRYAHSSSPKRRGDGAEEPKKKKKKEKKERKDDGTDHPDPEIAEANKLRAALGLKPLK
ncbi:PREDICTED: pre-mRNA-splicing factor 38 [Populus euphratica]|uniref:Pre-mRNA-splicing factor 38 n=1 Tax=Populus euphratica TaxID=75702 RepID=A0AAJ6U6V7_POPEU|nr:PREDICTED: pre-mRNA-splicing factor 38 [Populus euphratica]